MAVTMGQPAIFEEKVDLVIPQGTDVEFEFEYATKPEGWADGDPLEPVNLTGWTARAQIRTAPGRDVWLTLTSGAGIALGGATGTITLTIGHAVTETDAWNTRRTGKWDLELIDTAGKVTRLVEGTVTVSHDVTRDA